MFTLMRKFFKPVIWLVAIAFIVTIFYGWGMQSMSRKDPQISAAKVGSIYISTEDLNEAMNNYRKNFPDFDDFPTSVQNTIRKSVLDELINQNLIMLQAKKEGITVRDEEVLNVIRSMFIQNGVFNQQAFIEAQRFHSKEQWRQIEDDTRYRILNYKLYNLIIGSVKLTDPEVYNFFNSLYRQYEIQSIFIDPKEAIRHSEIEEYYNNNAEKFYEPVKYAASHILIATNPDSSTQELEIARIKINNINSLVNRGEVPFEELARRYSEDRSSAARGGMLLEFEAEDMVPEFSNAVSRLNAGEISPIVATELGYHIIRLEYKKENVLKPLIEVEFEIKNTLLSDTHWEDAGQTAKKAYDEIKASLNFDFTARRYSNSISAGQGGYIGWVARFSDPEIYGENILFNASELLIDGEAFLLPSVFENLLSVAPNEITEPFKSQKGWHIIKLLDMKQAETAKFEEFKSLVHGMILNQKQQAVWDRWIAAIRKNYDIEYFIEFDTGADRQAAIEKTE